VGKFIPVEPEKWAEMVKAQAEVARLEALTSEMDKTINASQLECRSLKAEVERLTEQVAGLIVSLQKSHDEHGEALYKLKYKNERKTSRKKRGS